MEISFHNYKCPKCGLLISGTTGDPFHIRICKGKVKQNMNFEDIPDVQEEIDKNPILKEVQDLLTTQTEKGLKKYPRTVNPDDYSITEWIDHVLQEKTDEIVYLVTLKHKIKKVIG